MNAALATTAAAAVVRDLPTAPTRGDLTLREVCDAYMAGYNGRDDSRDRRLSYWAGVMGDVKLRDLDGDSIADSLDALAAQNIRKYVGRDDHDRPVFREHGRRSPATVNRYRQALSAVLTWAQHKRLTPKGWAHPVRPLRSEREDNARVRFLSADERQRLLAAARISAWPKLYLLILMALTTGARRGELLGLRHRDLDLEIKTASVATTKNGEPRVLPLTDAVVNEIKRHGSPHPDALLFPGRFRTEQPYAIEEAWRRCLRNARVRNCRFHDLRHSCASYLAQNGAGLLEIADVLGHKSLKMTQRYSHLTVEHKAKLVRRVLGGIGGTEE
ncbi:MAG: tyrosine-type recombinase/integrase [Betaproteobacteria bacterium]